MHLRLGRTLALASALSVLAGCPEERPDAKRPLPRERFPPAMPVQQPRREAGIGPAPARVPAASTAGDAGTSPSAPGPTPLPERGPAPAPAGAAAPAPTGTAAPAR